MRVSLQPALILHRRPYRETSYIIDFLTQDHGRIAAVAKGIRKERSKSHALLQPFIPLLISYQGKQELMTLSKAESNGIPIRLQKDCLLAAFYLNELLVRLLQKHDPYPDLYQFYYQTLVKLQAGTLHQETLRLFEKRLLKEIGYGLQLNHSVPGKEAFMTDKYYHFQPDQGFMISEKNEKSFSGKSILDLAAEKLEDENSLRDAKRIMRMVFSELLGNKPLQSRRLFA